MDIETNDENAVERGSDRARRKRRGLIGLVLVLVLAAAGGALAWEWRHAEADFSYGYGIKPVIKVDQRVWTTLADSESQASDVITFSDLEPIFETDGTKATVEYLVCELDPVVLEKEGVGGFGYGMRDVYVDQVCADTWPAVGADLTRSPGVRQELLVGITPTRRGRTVITGHHVTYREGWRRGSSDIHVETVLEPK